MASLPASPFEHTLKALNSAHSNMPGGHHFGGGMFIVCTSYSSLRTCPISRYLSRANNPTSEMYQIYCSSSLVSRVQPHQHHLE